MSRVINVNGTPATQRNRLRRLIAESLVRLNQKPALDEESKDLIATIVFALRAMNESVESTADAWNKRDYYMKADRFLREWAWLGPMERLLTNALLYEEWDELPPLLGQLAGYHQDIQVSKLTKDDALWRGAMARLREEQHEG